MSKTPSTNKDINDLVQRLTKLKLQRKEIIQEEEGILTELLSLSSDKGTKSPTSPLKTSSYTHDRHGKQIDIGDTVEFLTPTKFEGKTGIVHSFSTLRVTTLNEKGRKVSKKSHNLAIRKKNKHNNQTNGILYAKK